ncbi:GNAT family N-acetyltransferase [Desulfopila sp. IMCC35008]|uniref:GNAT family N-acetyltransferase n=1 Tax=Desulfopila sp. IMCC35008 TaxID=2653858 RepID=UPI0013D179B3|nr:GNAT family N-acetyltransferase [Desulfopila sp. IMCC35008]
MEILQAERKDCELLASIVSKSNKDVAELFGLNVNNAPKHPSFCTSEWIVSELDRGQKYFLSTENGMPCGCVAFEQPDKDTAYLNRLSVVPEFRNKGIGGALVQHIIDYSYNSKVRDLSIGIIAEHTHLKEWYEKQGFREGALRQFAHLPFNVLYMHYEIVK